MMTMYFGGLIVGAIIGYIIGHQHGTTKERIGLPVNSMPKMKNPPPPPTTFCNKGSYEPKTGYQLSNRSVVLPQKLVTGIADSFVKDFIYRNTIARWRLKSLKHKTKCGSVKQYL